MSNSAIVYTMALHDNDTKKTTLQNVVFN